MKKFNIEITEILQKNISIKAKDFSQALELISRKYKDEEIVLSSEDYISTDFSMCNDNEEVRELINDDEFNDFLEKNLKEAILNSTKEELIKFAFGDFQNAINQYKKYKCK